MQQSQNNSSWPDDVGIIATEIYFPYTFVDQSELETFDGVSSGKYTIGLGQGRMGFCTDREDINSLAMTVVQNLMTRNNLSYNDIGRLEVGTETIIDKSKSVKSSLMQLFTASGNTNVEGIDTTNACYGGTNALFNALNWVESSAWDGRYALVVAADIAVYASGNARPTGGAGAVALLVGQNAPLIADRGMRGTHMEHAYDFYKPDLMSEYPVVDGKLSIECYLNALDKCYSRYRQRVNAKDSSQHRFTLDSADAFLFHSPFCKLVQKSFARLLLNDLLEHPEPDMSEGSIYAGLQDFRSAQLQDTFFDRNVEKAMMTASNNYYKKKTLPSLLLANQVGNMYTPSVYGGLISYLSTLDLQNAPNKKIVMFSYGSGLASSMFSFRVSNKNTASGSPLDRLLQSVSDLKNRLDARLKVDPAEFEANMKLRQDTHHLAPYSPVGSVDHLFPGTWYLTNIDDKHRRQYECFQPKTTALQNGQTSS